MPPKPPCICRAATAWPGWLGRPGYSTAATAGDGRRAEQAPAPYRSIRSRPRSMCRILKARGRHSPSGVTSSGQVIQRPGARVDRGGLANCRAHGHDDDATESEGQVPAGALGVGARRRSPCIWAYPCCSSFRLWPAPSCVSQVYTLNTRVTAGGKMPPLLRRRRPSSTWHRGGMRRGDRAAAQNAVQNCPESSPTYDG